MHFMQTVTVKKNNHYITIKPPRSTTTRAVIKEGRENLTGISAARRHEISLPPAAEDVLASGVINYGHLSTC